MNCPHCNRTGGHYSVVEYKCITTGKMVSQRYWFCHNDATLVYDDEPEFEDVKTV